MAEALIKAEISYCPDLDLYHYRRGSGEEVEEYFFDTPRLEQVIDSYGVSGNQKEAELLAFVTGLSRRVPHRVLTIDPEGKVTFSPVRTVQAPSGSGLEG